jgi:ABC-type Zn uptake system ZnuABC Zn-binding protein ZnuA
MHNTAYTHVLLSRRYYRRLLLPLKTAIFAAAIISALFGSAFAETLQVAVSILPQEYFVKKIGGDFVSVTVLVPPGATPENYELKPRQMVALSECRIYFAIGVPFETAWLPKISSGNQRMIIVRTDEGIRKIAMTAHHHHDGDGSHDEESSDGLLDPHIWLSPSREDSGKPYTKGSQQADRSIRTSTKSISTAFPMR